MSTIETEISKSKFKAHALEIFRMVESTGEPVIITDHGTPSLIVSKYTRAKTDVRDVLAGSVLRYEGALEPVAEEAWDALA